MANPRKTSAVGGDGRTTSSRWYSAFLWGVAAISVAVIVLLITIAGAFGGSSTAKTTAKTSGAPVGDGSSIPSAETSEPPTTTRAGETTGAPTKVASSTAAATTTPAPDGDNSTLVRCGDVLAPLDKQHRLGPDCSPSDLVGLGGSISAEGPQALRAEAASALQDLFAAARKDGYQLLANSTYRSYANQVDTYNYWVRTNGQEYADRTSARPGHSEHQLGTTADVGTDGHFLESFTGTQAAKWLADNSWKYGFIVSYPQGKEGVTGYAAEPWHIRYVGKDVASRVQSSGLTLHEFLLR